MSKLELIYAFTIRLLSAILGFGIAVWETLADHVAHPWAYAAATGFIGGPMARAITEFVKVLANSETPPMPVVPDPEGEPPKAPKR